MFSHQATVGVLRRGLFKCLMVCTIRVQSCLYIRFYHAQHDFFYIELFVSIQVQETEAILCAMSKPLTLWHLYSMLKYAPPQKPSVHIQSPFRPRMQLRIVLPIIRHRLLTLTQLLTGHLPCTLHGWRHPRPTTWLQSGGRNPSRAGRRARCRRRTSRHRPCDDCCPPPA